MMSPATTLLKCWTTLRRFSCPVQDKEEEEEDAHCSLDKWGIWIQSVIDGLSQKVLYL
jgi:hypothetical protein